LTAFSIRQRNYAAALVSALEVEVIVILNGSTEKGLAGVTREPAEVETFGHVAAHTAVLDRSTCLVVPHVLLLLMIIHHVLIFSQGIY